MRLDDDARVILGWTAELTTDPTDATVVLQIGNDERHPMTWTSDAEQNGSRWTRKAQTVDMLAGTKRPDGSGDIHLPRGRHMAEVILTMPDGQVLPSQPFPIDVR